MPFVIRFALFLMITFSALIGAARVVGARFPSDEITFMSWETGGDVASLDVRARLIRKLVAHPAYEESFVWSPDGTQLAFVSNRDFNRDVFVMDSDGRNLRRVTHADTDSVKPVWSPDSQHLVYLFDVSVQDANTELHLVNVRTGETRPITDDPAQEIEPVWLPDGKQLVYISNRLDDGSYDYSRMLPDKLYLVNVETGQHERLSTQTRLVYSPAASPDGTMLSFTVATETGPVLVIFSLETRKNLFSLEEGYGAKWSPDGTRLAYLKSHAGVSFDACVVDVSTRAETCVNNIQGEAYHPDWSPDGERITFGVYRANVNAAYVIMVMNADGSDLHAVTDGVIGYFSPEWRPVKTR